MSIFRKAVGKELSVREVERLVRERGKKTTARRSTGSAQQTSSLQNIEERLRQFLGTKVQVRMLQDGKGEIVIEYYSADDLERLLEIFSELQDRSR